jgi:hypothetical protein
MHLERSRLVLHLRSMIGRRLFRWHQGAGTTLPREILTHSAGLAALVALMHLSLVIFSFSLHRQQGD